MENRESFTSPELQKERQNREVLIKISEDFLMDSPIDDVDLTMMSDRELGEYLQIRFQQNLQNFYEQSGLAQEIAECKNDEEVLHLIANRSEGVHGWMDMLPNLIKLEPKAGMNCTMSSAVLHMGLEALGYQNVRTLVVKGHSLLMRELEDGSIKLYDSSSKSTLDGKLVGYTHTFSPNQISNRAEVEEKGERKGFRFTLERGEKDDQGGFHMTDSEGKFTKNFYAFDPSIKMDVATALGNLSEIKKDAEKLGGVEELLSIDRNDYLRELANFIRRNNALELSNDDIETIGHQNPQAIDQIMEQALKSLASEGVSPNPFDFLKSDLIKPIDNMESPPSVKLFTKEAEERHEHAKKLVSDFPELKDLVFDETVKQFDLFSSEPYTSEAGSR